jgi:2-oxoglutarate ferredoxin oxidoreductase subunit beta
MGWQRFARKEALPLKWCLGCGLHVMFQATCEVLDELNLENTVVISGIGCTGRGAGFFNLDSVHGIHGRAIPLAVGMKKANPKLNVLIFSGDGDLLGIGGNHLLHAALRNDNITVICNHNEVFAMTGGQASPTTKIGGITTTTPEGNIKQPINAQGILLSNEKYFYARSSMMHKEHLKKCLKEAMEYEGFSFIEVISPCIINYGRRMGMDVATIYKEVRTNFIITGENRELKNNELGIVKNDKNQN